MNDWFTCYNCRVLFKLLATFFVFYCGHVNGGMTILFYVVVMMRDGYKQCSTTQQKGYDKEVTYYFLHKKTSFNVSSYKGFDKNYQYPFMLFVLERCGLWKLLSYQIPICRVWRKRPKRLVDDLQSAQLIIHAGDWQTLDAYHFLLLNTSIFVSPLSSTMILRRSPASMFNFFLIVLGIESCPFCVVFPVFSIFMKRTTF